MKKILILAVAVVLLVGCRESTRVSYNVSREADAFNVTRRLVVINSRSDEPVLDLVGKFSISTNDKNELEVTVKTGANEFKKHFVYLNEWTKYPSTSTKSITSLK